MITHRLDPTVFPKKTIFASLTIIFNIDRLQIKRLVKQLDYMASCDNMDKTDFASFFARGQIVLKRQKKTVFMMPCEDTK